MCPGCEITAVVWSNPESVAVTQYVNLVQIADISVETKFVCDLQNIYTYVHM